MKLVQGNFRIDWQSLAIQTLGFAYVFYLLGGYIGKEWSLVLGIIGLIFGFIQSIYFQRSKWIRTKSNHLSENSKLNYDFSNTATSKLARDVHYYVKDDNRLTNPSKNNN